MEITKPFDFCDATQANGALTNDQLHNEGGIKMKKNCKL